MKFDELKRAVQENHDAFGTSPGALEYASVMDPNHIRWDNLSLDDANKVLDFLNKWGRCRLSHELAGSLLRSLQTVAMFVKPILNKRIEDTILKEVVRTGRERLTVQRIAHCAFDELASIAGFGPVPASKTLHVLVPGFFVMWDNAISRRYGCRLRGYDYAFKFLPRMQAEIEECVADLKVSLGLNESQSLEYIRDEGARILGESRTVAKLVDEYNWTPGKIKGSAKKDAERQLIAAHKEEYDKLLKAADGNVKE
jgi:hypothetical protein